MTDDGYCEKTTVDDVITLSLPNESNVLRKLLPLPSVHSDHVMAYGHQLKTSRQELCLHVHDAIGCQIE